MKPLFLLLLGLTLLVPAIHAQDDDTQYDERPFSPRAMGRMRTRANLPAPE